MGNWTVYGSRKVDPKARAAQETERHAGGNGRKVLGVRRCSVGRFRHGPDDLDMDLQSIKARKTC